MTEEAELDCMSIPSESSAKWEYEAESDHMRCSMINCHEPGKTMLLAKFVERFAICAGLEGEVGDGVLDIMGVNGVDTFDVRFGSRANGECWRDSISSHGGRVTLTF